MKVIVVKLAKVFGVSSDYLLGLTDIRFPKQIEMEQLGLSEQGIKVLAANQINGKIISRFLTDQGFCHLMNLSHAYFQRRKSWNNDFVTQGKKNYVGYKKEHPIKSHGYDESVPEFDTYRDQDEERELMDLTKRFEQAMKRIRKSYGEKEPEMGDTPEEVSDAYFACAEAYTKRKEEGAEEITIRNGVPVPMSKNAFRKVVMSVGTTKSSNRRTKQLLDWLTDVVYEKLVKDYLRQVGKEEKEQAKIE